MALKVQINNEGNVTAIGGQTTVKAIKKKGLVEATIDPITDSMQIAPILSDQEAVSSKQEIKVKQRYGIDWLVI